MLVLVLSSFASAAPPTSTDPFEKCHSDSQDALYWAEGLQGMGYVTFATKQLGPAKSCILTFTPSPDGLDASLELHYAKGVVLTLKNMPPESAWYELYAPKGFPDEAAVRAFLRSDQPLGPDGAIAWDTPQVEDDPHGKATVWWDPDEGMNFSVREIVSDDHLVGIRSSWAL